MVGDLEMSAQLGAIMRLPRGRLFVWDVGQVDLRDAEWEGLRPFLVVSKGVVTRGGTISGKLTGFSWSGPASSGV